MSEPKTQVDKPANQPFDPKTEETPSHSTKPDTKSAVCLHIHTIVFGCDHNGGLLKKGLIEFAKQIGYQVCDCPLEDGEDYIDLTRKVIHKMEYYPESFGVLICGSGFGMCMAANRHPRMKAALCRTWEDTEYCRRQNDANILCLGAEFTTLPVAQECLRHFATRPFKQERHFEHVNKLLTKAHF